MYAAVRINSMYNMLALCIPHQCIVHSSVAPSTSEDVLTGTSSYSSSVQPRSLKKHKIVSEMTKNIQSEQSCIYSPTILICTLKSTTNTYFLSEILVDIVYMS